MSAGNAKDLRKQVRNVVQEILPELLKSEVFKGLYEQLQKEMVFKLGEIRADVNKSLSTMDNRSKDVQQFIMNQVTQEMAKSNSKIL